MKINATFTKRPKIRIKEPLKSDIKNKILLLSVFDIALGIAVGSMLFISNTKYISGELMEFFINFETDFSGKNFAEIFFGFLAANIIYVALTVIFGASSIGELPIALMTLVKSIGIGSLTAYLFSEYGLHGFEYFLLVFFPGKVVLLFAMVMLIQNATLSSHQIRQVIKGISTDYMDIKLYLIRTACILLIFALSCLVDSVAIKLFSPLFSFNS
ncbi:MAG: stage II sporulation protein M [Faecalibacterium sp.]|nr:stage II sporulation protein M [Ruminococcus sp.]MCM1392303.1 stage II sporulation protein M [Ruminococcus sp.]MCM1484715.1 stage II sporulation protein M [Faecalibacterium sp.]